MALFNECMLQCAQKVLDPADIVRDGDFRIASPAVPLRGTQGPFHSADFGT
jgi:hypothetical protein